MFDLSTNYRISRKIATDGMILLKNEENVLPFTPNSRVGVVGKSCLDLIKGGGGSAAVMTEYTRSLNDGLWEKHKENKFFFYEESIAVAESNDYSIQTLNELANNIDTAIVTYKRSGTEGSDRQLGKQSEMKIEIGAYSGEQDDGNSLDDYEEKIGYFYPSDSELKLFLNLEESNIKNVVLILNISATVDLSFIHNFKKIKAVLLAYLPGMESGTAIADVLCGDVNPSGRLVDTIAYKYEDYPSSETFNNHPQYTEYKEGIYVGYRYFETFAKEKVMYPFGYGLSYTEFEFTDCMLDIKDDAVNVFVTVTNTGTIPGKEVVQIYVKPPVGQLPKPEIELKGYAKTKNLQPGECETVVITIQNRDISSFDDMGILGFKSAWVLEEGEYGIFAGKNIRDLYSCGIYTQEKTVVTQQLTARFNGEQYVDDLLPLTEDVGCDRGITLYDVAENKATMEEFIGQLTIEEMISLANGQSPAFPLGTSGVGNLKNKRVPNPQTADGPAGIRRSVNTTCFPCGTLVASSWDSDLQYEMGKAMGVEAYSTGIDVILAPSMNIHRNPLCGRNFEYLSEDPFITGRTATALVKGVQREGACATVKHFAANNCEYYRSTNNSIIGERALREIYLKGFEMVIKEGNPTFVMSSYNKLNGIHTSANPQLMSGILRDEWHYEGAVMTDWRNNANMDDEIIAGNNIKMPCGYPDQEALALQSYKDGKLTLAHLQKNAFYVLKAVMKTRSFAQKDFGIQHVMKGNELTISAIDVNGVSSTRVMESKREDGKGYLYQLNKDQRGQRTFVYYSVTVEKEGEYTVSAEVSTNCPDFEICFMNERNEKMGTAFCNIAEDPDKWYIIQTKIYLNKGENIVKLVFDNEPGIDCEFCVGFMLPSEDIKLAELTFTNTDLGESL